MSGVWRIPGKGDIDLGHFLLLRAFNLLDASIGSFIQMSIIFGLHILVGVVWNLHFLVVDLDYCSSMLLSAGNSATSHFPEECLFLGWQTFTSATICNHLRPLWSVLQAFSPLSFFIFFPCNCCHCCLYLLVFYSFKLRSRSKFFIGSKLYLLT